MSGRFFPSLMIIRQKYHDAPRRFNQYLKTSRAEFAASNIFAQKSLRDVYFIRIS